MNLIFIPMLIGHFVADFWLQPASWVADKNFQKHRSGKLLLHSFIASVLPVLFTFNLKCWWFFLVIFVTHYFCDWFKSLKKENLFWFLFDQIVHVLVILALSQSVLGCVFSQPIIYYLVLVLAFIVASTPAGIFTDLFLNQVIKKEKKENKLDASAWIGIIERMLIIGFILAGEFQAIGFLIAAKSVFRFNDIQKGESKKAEYFLLGTLVSFAIAIGIGMGIKFMIY